MHAVIGSFAMEPAKMELQRKELGERIIPMVRQLTGFVAGYWNYDPSAATSYSYIVWETEEQAKKLVEIVKGNVSNQADAGVSIRTLSVVEVWGHANG